MRFDSVEQIIVQHDNACLEALNIQGTFYRSVVKSGIMGVSKTFVLGSNPSRPAKHYISVTQRTECHASNVEVAGSTPAGDANLVASPCQHKRHASWRGRDGVGRLVAVVGPVV